MNIPAPEPSGSLPLSREERVDRVCDAFERQWKMGQQPRIEDYLDRAAEGDRPRLLRELLALEWQFRAAAGEHPVAEEYRKRFPGDAAILDVAWAEFESGRPDLAATSTVDFLPDHDTPNSNSGKPPEMNEPEETPTLAVLCENRACRRRDFESRRNAR
jgi:hypothetical protein